MRNAIAIGMLLLAGCEDNFKPLERQAAIVAMDECKQAGYKPWLMRNLYYEIVDVQCVPANDK